MVTTLQGIPAGGQNTQKLSKKRVAGGNIQHDNHRSKNNLYSPGILNIYKKKPPPLENVVILLAKGRRGVSSVEAAENVH